MDEDTPTQVQQDVPAVADTTPAPTSEANVQANDTPEVAEAQETTVNTTDTVEESKLYAGKYKTVEDMEKAYQELNSKFTSTTQEKAELSRILADAFSSEPDTTPQPQASYEDDYEDAPTAPKQDDGVARDLSVLKFVVANPDADGAAMLEVLKNDPLVANINGYDAKFRYAYAISQNMSKSKAVEEARKQAQIETQVKIAEKQAAQVEPASKQAPPTKEEPLTREQLRAALKSDDAFGEILKKRPGFKNYVG